MRVVAAANRALELQLAAHAGVMYAVLHVPAIYEYENEPPPSQEGP